MNVTCGNTDGCTPVAFALGTVRPVTTAGGSLGRFVAALPPDAITRKVDETTTGGPKAGAAVAVTV